jgi:hypothetical protein
MPVTSMEKLSDLIMSALRDIVGLPECPKLAPKAMREQPATNIEAGKGK